MNIRDPYANMDATMAYPMTDAEKVLDALKDWLSNRIEICEVMRVGATLLGHDTTDKMQCTKINRACCRLWPVTGSTKIGLSRL